jgi:hypothetical protein
MAVALPFVPLLFEFGGTPCGQSIVTTNPALFDFCKRFDKALLFQTVEGGIKSSFLEIENAVRLIANILNDPIAVLGAGAAKRAESTPTALL